MVYVDGFRKGYDAGLKAAKETPLYTRVATIYFHGDPSVGIQSYSFDVQIPETALDDREFTRGMLKECYKQIDGENTPMVIFNDENYE